MNDLDIAVASTAEVHARINGYGHDWKGWARFVERVVSMRPDIGPALARDWGSWSPACTEQGELLAAIGFVWLCTHWKYRRTNAEKEEGHDGRGL